MSGFEDVHVHRFTDDGRYLICFSRNQHDLVVYRFKGFGAADERRDKDAIIVAAEAFADGAEGFTFDKPTGESLSKEVKKQAQNAKKGSLMKGLFDRT